VTQQEHLTTEQLSAFLDKQLTPQEQAFFDAHLQSCQHCQAVLAELRGTVALLHAMPQPSLPRSFTLPAGLSQMPAARPRLQPLPVQQRRAPRYVLRRTVRAFSTLAAAIAVLFILSGLLANVHLGAGGARTTASAPSYGNANQTTHVPAARPNLTQEPQAKSVTPTANDHQTRSPSASPVVPTPTPRANSTLDRGKTGVTVI
jgi:anti-sigma factor RsiW